MPNFRPEGAGGGRIFLVVFFFLKADMSTASEQGF